MTKTRIHPETGKELHRDVREQTVSYAVLNRKVKVPGWYPDDDSDAIHTGADLEEMNNAFKTLKMEYAAHVRSIRKKLKLTQVEAGQIIGGGPRGFQKYESGKIPPSTAAAGLIELLNKHPEEVSFLRSIQSGDRAIVRNAQSGQFIPQKSAARKSAKSITRKAG